MNLSTEKEEIFNKLLWLFEHATKVSIRDESPFIDHIDSSLRSVANFFKDSGEGIEKSVRSLQRLAQTFNKNYDSSNLKDRPSEQIVQRDAITAALFVENIRSILHSDSELKKEASYRGWQNGQVGRFDPKPSFSILN